MSDSFAAADFYGDEGGEVDLGEVAEAAVPEPEDAGPVAADEAGGQAEVTEQPEPTYFDLTQYADQKTRVKVGGEDVEVPVAELVQGYQRQADYTRKTQEIAQQREQLAFWQQVDAAMRANPQMTIEYLQKQFGVQPAPAATEAEDDDWGYEDPAVKRAIAEVKQQVAPALEFVQQQQAERYLSQVLDGLSSRYGDDFNAQEVCSEAVARGIDNPDLLEPLFKDMMFERYRAQQAAQNLTAGQRAAQEAQRQQAAAQASQVIGASGSVQSGRVGAAPEAQPRSVAEAWALAKAELEADGLI